MRMEVSIYSIFLTKKSHINKTTNKFLQSFEKY